MVVLLYIWAVRPSAIVLHGNIQWRPGGRIQSSACPSIFTPLYIFLHGKNYKIQLCMKQVTSQGLHLKKHNHPQTSPRKKQVLDGIRMRREMAFGNLLSKKLEFFFENFRRQLVHEYLEVKSRFHSSLAKTKQTILEKTETRFCE